MMMIIDNLSGHLEVVVALFEPKVKTLKLHFQSSTIKSFEHMQSEKKFKFCQIFKVNEWKTKVTKNIEKPLHKIGCFFHLPKRPENSPSLLDPPCCPS